MAKGQILKLGFLVVVIVSILLHISPFTSFVENKFLDQQFRFLSTQFPKNLDKDVVIVAATVASRRSTPSSTSSARRPDILYGSTGRFGHGKLAPFAVKYLLCRRFVLCEIRI